MAAGVAVWQPKGSSREATPLEFQIKRHCLCRRKGTRPPAVRLDSLRVDNLQTPRAT